MNIKLERRKSHILGNQTVIGHMPFLCSAVAALVPSIGLLFLHLHSKLINSKEHQTSIAHGEQPSKTATRLVKRERERHTKGKTTMLEVLDLAIVSKTRARMASIIAAKRMRVPRRTLHVREVDR